MVEKLRVDVYGSDVPLQQLAGFGVPEPRVLTISPYDKGTIKAIEKAIQQSDLGVNPSNDGQIIRLVFPELTEERRKELVKVVRNRAEEGRVAVRNARRHARHELEGLEKDGEISKDDLDRTEKDLEKRTHEVVAEIDEHAQAQGAASCSPYDAPGRPGEMLLGGADTGSGGGSSLVERDLRRIVCPTSMTIDPSRRPPRACGSSVRRRPRPRSRASPSGPAEEPKRRRRPAPPEDVQPAARFPLPADRLPGEVPGPEVRPAPPPPAGPRPVSPPARCRSRTGPSHRPERCR